MFPAGMTGGIAEVALSDFIFAQRALRTSIRIQLESSNKERGSRHLVCLLFLLSVPSHAELGMSVVGIVSP